MGRNRPGNSAGFIGPVAEPVPPVRPVVTAINGVSYIPYESSVAFEEQIECAVTFDIPYTANLSDFSVDSAKFDLYMHEPNVLSIEPSGDASQGDTANIFFQGTKIMHVVTGEYTFSPHVVTFNDEEFSYVPLRSNDGVLQTYDIDDNNSSIGIEGYDEDISYGQPFIIDDVKFIFVGGVGYIEIQCVTGKFTGNLVITSINKYNVDSGNYTIYI